MSLEFTVLSLSQHWAEPNKSLLWVSEGQRSRRVKPLKWGRVGAYSRSALFKTNNTHLVDISLMSHSLSSCLLHHFWVVFRSVSPLHSMHTTGKISGILLFIYFFQVWTMGLSDVNNLSQSQQAGGKQTADRENNLWLNTLPHLLLIKALQSQSDF